MHCRAWREHDGRVCRLDVWSPGRPGRSLTIHGCGKIRSLKLDRRVPRQETFHAGRSCAWRGAVYGALSRVRIGSQGRSFLFGFAFETCRLLPCRQCIRVERLIDIHLVCFFHHPCSTFMALRLPEESLRCFLDSCKRRVSLGSYPTRDVSGVFQRVPISQQRAITCRGDSKERNSPCRPSPLLRTML